uniref:Uncharacterized protein n=1 Tax=Megaselia scalaris TaxID=36166 RepID=T1H2B0_MEGSC
MSRYERLSADDASIYPLNPAVAESLSTMISIWTILVSFKTIHSQILNPSPEFTVKNHHRKL